MDALNETGTSLSSRQIEVVATTDIVADLVERVGGERVKVETLIAPGLDVRRYQASEIDMDTLSDADVVFSNGLGYERRLAPAFERVDAHVRVFAVADALPRDRLLTGDPHVWQDVGLWQLAVVGVRDALTSLDRANAQIYHRNAARYDRELQRLDHWIRGRAAARGATADAAGYFERAYGFDVDVPDSLRGEATYVAMIRRAVEAGGA